MRPALALIFLLLIGCAQKTWIVEEPSEISNGLRIRVETQRWKHNPPWLQRYVHVLYLEVENRGNKPVPIRREDIFLIDKEGNQYNPFEPRDVLSLLDRKPRFSFSFGLGYWSSPYGMWMSPYYAYPYRENLYADVLNKAFSFGEVQPSARVKGFVYFPELPKGVSSVILHVMGYQFNLNVKTKS